MATTYTSIFRLAILQTGDPATNNTWGVVQDATMPLIEQGAVGTTPVNIAGLTTYSLTTANNATDQARYLVQQYAGALTGACTVTIPNLAKVGWAQNNTTGGFNVILSAGGTTATIPPDGQWYMFAGDGSANITLVPAGFNSITSNTNGTAGKQVVNFSQFAPGVGFINLPGGVLLNWGVSITPGGGTVVVPYAKAFSSGAFSVVCTPTAPGTGIALANVGSTTTFTAGSFFTSSGAAVGGVTFFWWAVGF